MTQSALSFSTATRNARMQALIDKIDAAADPGYIEFYTGTRGAGGSVSGGNTLCAKNTFSKPCGSIANGVATFAAIDPDMDVDASGIVTWARIMDGAGTLVAHANVTADQVSNGAGGWTAGAGPVKIDTGVPGSTQVWAGGIFRLTSFTITEGNI